MSRYPILEQARLMPENQKPDQEFAIKAASLLLEKANVMLPVIDKPHRRRIVTPEQQRKIDNAPKFSGLAKEKLTKLGYRFVQLTGESAQSLRREKRELTGSWYRRYSAIAAREGHITEAAYNPEDKFSIHLRDFSNRLAFKGQVSSVEKLSTALRRTMPDVRAIVGEAPDYLELLFDRHDQYGQFIFDYNLNTRLWTNTPSYQPDKRVCIIDGSNLDSLALTPVDMQDTSGYYVLPLVIPSSKANL